MAQLEGTRTDNPDGTYTIRHPSGRTATYEKDGTPCRTCDTMSGFKSVTKLSQRAEKPPTGGEIGRGTWTLLHSMAAKFPETPTPQQKNDAAQFMSILSRMYPCWSCASDFQAYIEENQVKASSKEEFGRWLCDAHNEVNEKLGKPKFECDLWRKRWG